MTIFSRRTRKLAIALGACLLTTPAFAEPVYATKVLVEKSKHRLHVYVGTKIVATYPVGFGVNPVGHKQQEGDRRTPEGRYVLDYKNPNSAFYRSIHISYPNANDVLQARKRGVSPGRDIMIHGQPGDPELLRRVKNYPYPDWTNGCISMADADLKALWDMIRVPVPIEIVP